ncbi:FAD-dependent oxidoreductase [Phycicoccus sp. CSK15P-2]|uniref:NAD(P)/FAD-dependent oxidoreductase n=1 Tax=Phycicoccus sp. CSK15P-2 TaxID=2807627 RepID=UPI001950C16D|nr:FAD-dependent oxidoreductase [Phycicoccus sp. CSK15P-2]MBM6406006.1 FAD-dependent oxidoreductase [Phycicoccus sp. CSK15P-2]
MESPRFVVVGGGPAAAAAARRIAEAGEPVALLTVEQVAPYDRTALSKDALLDPTAEVPGLWPPGATWRDDVFVRTRTPVAAIDPDAGTLTTDDGTMWAYERLVLATGAEPRRLAVTGAEGPGVHHLRDTADASALSGALTSGARLVVVGGGVIGLEVAAAAVHRGLDVEVVEAGPRVLGRGVPAPVALWLTALHTRHGVRVRTGVAPQEVVRAPDGSVTGVHLSDDTLLPADLVVVGIGVDPRTALAEDAGLAVDDGVVVDLAMRTSHPAVLAAGDGVRMVPPAGGRGVRLESFTAAGRQGEVAADTALGLEAAFTDAPWSWSDQYDATMQSAGVPPTEAEEVLVGGPEAPLVLSLEHGRLVGACGVSIGPGIARPVRAAGRAIEAGARVDLDALRAAGGDLPALARVLRDAAG